MATDDGMAPSDEWEDWQGTHEQEKEVIELVKKVKRIRAIIDRGVFLREQIRTADEELALIKKKVRQHAEATKQTTLKGTIGYVSVTPYVTSSIDPMKTWRKLGSKIAIFSKVVKVQAGLLSAHMSTAKIKSVSTRDEIPYRVVEFFKSCG